MNSRNKKIKLGWGLDPSGHPAGWRKSYNILNRFIQKKTIVSINIQYLTSCMAIIAQSGSGKSFFLGRLIEEIITNTNSNVFVIDPNGDFRAVYNIVPEEKWDSVVYDAENKIGWLPTEASGRDFRQKWSETRIDILSNISLRTDETIKLPHSRKSTSLCWFDVPAEFIADQILGASITEVQLCHNALWLIVKILHYYLKDTGAYINDEAIIDLASQIFHQKDNDIITKLIYKQTMEARKKINSNQVIIPEDEINTIKSQPMVKELYLLLRFLRAEIFTPYLSSVIQNISSHNESGSQRTFQFSPTSWSDDARLTILDIASEPTWMSRLTLLSAALRHIYKIKKDQWYEAMNNDPDNYERSPFFIIIDEAHHFIPKNPINSLQSRVLHQIQEIATEGRKLGLFLIIVSQRPDRLNSIVASECKNLAVMRLKSMDAVTSIKDTFSLDTRFIKILNKARQFSVGQTVLFGDWGGERPPIFFSAARRSIEGGRNIKIK